MQLGDTGGDVGFVRSFSSSRPRGCGAEREKLTSGALISHSEVGCEKGRRGIGDDLLKVLA